MHHKNYDVWISCDDEPLPEFSIQAEGDDGKTLACFIPSERGKARIAFYAHSMLYCRTIYASSECMSPRTSSSIGRMMARAKISCSPSVWMGSPFVMGVILRAAQAGCVLALLLEPIPNNFFSLQAFRPQVRSPTRLQSEFPCLYHVASRLVYR